MMNSSNALIKAMNMGKNKYVLFTSTILELDLQVSYDK